MTRLLYIVVAFLLLTFSGAEAQTRRQATLDLLNGPQATLDCQFTNYPNAVQSAGYIKGIGPKCPPIPYSRAGTRTCFNTLGVLVTLAANVPCLNYSPSTLAPQGPWIEEARTNSIRNNTMVGAAAGTPGTLPTNWAVSSLGTLTQTVVGTGTENGITYVDLRFNGTTSTTFMVILPELNTQIVSSQTQVWNSAVYLKLVGGNLTNVTSLIITVQSLTAAGAFISNGTSSNQVATLNANTGNPLAAIRPSVAYTIPDATNGRVNLNIVPAFSSGVAVDFTLRIGLPQLELGAFATSVIPTSGAAAAARAADVASILVSQFPFNIQRGTLIAQANTPNIPSRPDQNTEIFNLGTSSTEIIRPIIGSGGQSVATLQSFVGGVNKGALALTGTLSANTPFRVGMTYDVSSLVLLGAVNGNVVGTLTTTGIPSFSTLGIGGASTASRGFPLNGWITRLRYYPFAMNAQQLRSATQP